MLNVGLDNFVYADASIGAGFGVPLTRFVEITPLVMVGGYYDTQSKAIFAYTAEPAVRLMATFQPFAFGVTVGYQAFLGGMAAGGCLVAKGGIKWTF